MIDFLMLGGGLALLLAGGDVMVRGAAGLARIWGVSPLVIGLTIVAFGTSAPELAVNMLAAMQGSGGLAFGNVVGSNAANVGLVLGLTAIFGAVQIKGQIVAREIPLMLLGSVATLVLAADMFLVDRPNVIDRADGLILLLLFGVFLYTAIGDVLRKRRSDALLRQSGELPEGVPQAEGGVPQNLALVVLGLGGLLGGGHLAVEGARAIAEALGASEGLIGFTVVAVGTSLPELATSVIAARKGEPDIAIGNIVGSNIFNLLFVLGTTASIAGCELPEYGVLDLILATTLSLLLLPFALLGRRKVGRLEGCVLLGIWVAYGAWRFLA